MKKREGHHIQPPMKGGPPSPSSSKEHYSDNTNKNSSHSVMTNDNGNDNVSSCDVVLLDLLQSTNSLKDLVEVTRRKKPNVHRSLQRLRNKEYVMNQHGLYFLTPLGISVLESGRYPPNDGYGQMITGTLNQNATTFKKLTRLHHLSFTLKFWVIPPGWDQLRLTVFGLEDNLPGLVVDTDFNSRVERFKNNQKFKHGGTQSIKMDDYTIICYRNSIRVWVPEVIHHEPSMAFAMAWDSMKRVLPRLERWLHIPTQSLYSEGRLNVKVSTSHYALMKSAFSKYIVEEKGEKRFVIPAGDGKDRVIVDMSTGPEDETVHKDTALPDREVMNQIFTPWLDGEVPLPAEMWENIRMMGAQAEDLNKATVNMQSEVLPVLVNFSEQVAAHTGTAEANLYAANTLKDIMDQVLRLLRPLFIVSDLFVSVVSVVSRWIPFYTLRPKK